VQHNAPAPFEGAERQLDHLPLKNRSAPSNGASNKFRLDFYKHSTPNGVSTALIVLGPFQQITGIEIINPFLKNSD
jgi:hypothetical protein